MASISAAGIGSGLDINGLVTQLVAAEGQPTTLRLNRQEAVLQAEVSAIGVLKAALLEFQSSMKGLLDVNGFQPITATSGNTDVLTVSTGSGAIPGDHSVKVLNLAQTQKLASKGFSSSTEPLGTGTLTFRFGTYDGTANTFTANPDKGAQSVVIDSSNNSLEGIRDAVNKANIGINASIVDDGTGKRLVFSSKDSGAVNSLSVSVSGDSVGDDLDDVGLSQLAYDPTAAGLGSGKNLIETVAAKDAKIEVDGLTITRPNNTVTGVIEGVTLNLKKEDSALTVALSVTKNSEAIKTKINDFVDAFNKFKEVVGDLTRFDSETRVSGELLGDAALRGIENQIRRIIANTVPGVTGAFQSLGSIGVKTQRDGTLSLDSAALDKAIQTDAEGVARLFAKGGAATDALVEFSASTDASVVGEYAVNITQLASRGVFTGSTASGFPLSVDGTNDNFAIKVNGVQSGTISLTQGSYASGAELAAEIQGRINADSALKGGNVSVTVSFDTDHFEITSSEYGSASKVEVTSVDSNSAVIGLAVGAGTDGVDVAGSIGGVVAIGSGQTLTGTGSSSGIALEFQGGSIGDRGTVSFARGVSVQLDVMLKGVLGNQGVLKSRIEGLNDRISRIDDKREVLNRRLASLEDRYRKQFTALDTLLSQLQGTSAFLSQQLASLPGPRKLSSKQ
ncbi:MAG: flagellar filament capping protein FliD [Pseudomonadota bacterium]